jgi:hypothetical protein
MGAAAARRARRRFEAARNATRDRQLAGSTRLYEGSTRGDNELLDQSG